MATEKSLILMIYEGDVAVVAFRRPSALLAHNDRSEPAPILKHDCLFLIGQGVKNALTEWG